MAEYYTRIKDKLSELEKYISELEMIIPKEFEDYEKDIIIKAACERYFEKISEAIYDLCRFVIRHEGVEIKGNEIETIFKLDVIDEEFKLKLKNIKAMRNFIIHQYEKTDDSVMYESLKKQLIKDSKEFANIIKEYLEAKKNTCEPDTEQHSDVG
ncbi:MAG: DUF86 domain-containing protein [Nanoarchaeota archaeon]|nr:DUF86 domain-containing protein [Nanoarchaeota archaeon]MBU1604294.1 DUF86 domain-containing protein [Nanoarchaeota archaeon]